MADLRDAYARINAELRSQYLIAFSSDHVLTDDELRTITVDVSGPKFEVRAVIGGRQVD